MRKYLTYADLHSLGQTMQLQRENWPRWYIHIDGLAQDCSNSSALAMELLQSCAKPSICQRAGLLIGSGNGLLLFIAKPLPKTMTTNCQLDPCHWNSVNIFNKNVVHKTWTTLSGTQCVNQSCNNTTRDSSYWHQKEVKQQSSLHLNPLHAKCLRENINIYLHFLSFLHTNETQVVNIPPPVRQGPVYST